MGNWRNLTPEEKRDPVIRKAHQHIRKFVRKQRRYRMKNRKTTDWENNFWGEVWAMRPPWYVLVGALLASIGITLALMCCVYGIIDRIKQ